MGSFLDGLREELAADTGKRRGEFVMATKGGEGFPRLVLTCEAIPIAEFEAFAKRAGIVTAENGTSSSSDGGVAGNAALIAKVTTEVRFEVDGTPLTFLEWVGLDGHGLTPEELEQVTKTVGDHPLRFDERLAELFAIDTEQAAELVQALAVDGWAVNGCALAIAQWNSGASESGAYELAGKEG